tara:strand:+ start:2039 stop:3070 length:1032 start_codon:yes stop_codon:yes gene_type:complete
MKILITGVTGMVGSHLLDKCIDNIDRYELIVCACRWRSNDDNIAHIYSSKHVSNKRIIFEHMDLRDSLSVSNLISKYKPFDHVFHLAAQSYPHVSFTSPMETFETNINGTYNLLNFLREYSGNSKVHVCSSSEVFGRVSKEFVPINENVPFHPASPYAISKVGTDLIGKYFFDAFGLKVFITRMFTHTGPRRGDVFHESSFAKQVALIENGLIPSNTIYVGNLKSLRTYADVRDAVNAYYLLMDSSKTGFGEAYNIGGDYTCNVEETLDFLIKSSIKSDLINIKVDPNRLRPIDADLQIPDISKFKKVINWKRKYSYQDTMIDLLDYWRGKIKNDTSKYRLVR